MCLPACNSSISRAFKSIRKRAQTVSIGFRSPLQGGKLTDCRPFLRQTGGFKRKPSLSCQIFDKAPGVRCVARRKAGACCAHSALFIFGLRRPKSQRKIPSAGKAAPERNLVSQLHTISVQGVELWVQPLALTHPHVADAFSSMLGPTRQRLWSLGQSNPIEDEPDVALPPAWAVAAVLLHKADLVGKQQSTSWGHRLRNVWISASRNYRQYGL